MNCNNYNTTRLWLLQQHQQEEKKRATARTAATTTIAKIILITPLSSITFKMAGHRNESSRTIYPSTTQNEPELFFFLIFKIMAGRVRGTSQARNTVLPVKPNQPDMQPMSSIQFQHKPIL